MEMQKNQGKKRSIGWLIDKVAPVITNPYIAGLILIFLNDYNMSPNEVHKKIFEGIKKGSSIDERKKLAQSARWLAIIYRDYGQEVFQQVIDLVKKVDELQPKNTRHEKIEIPKVPKKKALHKKLPLPWFKKVLKKRKERPLEVLKKKARLYVKSEHQDIFCKRLAQDKKVDHTVIYNIGYALGKNLPIPVPKKMGISAVCALLIYEDYGPQAFKEFFDDVLKENNKT